MADYGSHLEEGSEQAGATPTCTLADPSGRPGDGVHVSVVVTESGQPEGTAESAEGNIGSDILNHR